jgi:hypothetical protein
MGVFIYPLSSDSLYPYPKGMAPDCQGYWQSGTITLG